MKLSFAIAPHFSVKGSWSDRLLVAADDGWRPPLEEELAGLTTPSGDESVCFRLFSVPMHIRSRFWAMLNDEATAETGDFEYFSDDLADFLDFKDMAPPKEAVCELVVQDAAGKVTTGDIWALINFGEEPVVLAWPRQQLRLNPGEGCRCAPQWAADVQPPPADELNALFVIRQSPA